MDLEHTEHVIDKHWSFSCSLLIKVTDSNKMTID